VTRASRRKRAADGRLRSGKPALRGEHVDRKSGSNILIHVRFRPDGEIWQITQCPETLTPGEWFKKLCARVGDKFQTRSGGRGLFRLSAEQLDALRTAQVH
jgi:hypothetical protein